MKGRCSTKRKMRRPSRGIGVFPEVKHQAVQPKEKRPEDKEEAAETWIHGDGIFSNQMVSYGTG